MSKRKGEMVISIQPDGTVRVQILNNDDPGHSVLLEPFTGGLSDGDKTKVHAHKHDHGHGQHTHEHGGH